ncbi:unnamed protein product [Mytilus coruscus]|uniref:Uncharacterized protein n=1 Tax=Mytilus coruscus TaxID=42192 RepID=A0A6J8A5Q0_MYTCO|nr:unnamed protein product [Mytilus coruscus]
MADDVTKKPLITRVDNGEKDKIATDSEQIKIATDNENKIQELSVKSANGIQINSEHFLELKTQLEDIETYKCKGAILRSKSQWALESDRNTAYFLKLEKYRQNKNVISEIKDCDGKIVTETNDLLDVIHDYYKHLFSCVSIDMHSVDELLNNVNVKLMMKM